MRTLTSPSKPNASVISASPLASEKVRSVTADQVLKTGRAPAARDERGTPVRCHLLAEVRADLLGRVADGLHRRSSLFSGHPERLGPIRDLVLLAQGDVLRVR